MRFSSKSIFLFIILIILISSGCQNSKNSQSQQKQLQGNNQSPETQKSPLKNSESQNVPISKAEPKESYPAYVDQYFRVFCNTGISGFYILNKHVPKDWDEYIHSGIPLLIPNDYLTGKTYHPVDELNMDDTSGVKFTSDEKEFCKFEFILKDENTGKNFIKPVELDMTYLKDTVQSYTTIAKDAFDTNQRNQVVLTLTTYTQIYAQKHDGNAPTSLAEMLKGEGALIEEGWKWHVPRDSKHYFEFGCDIEKARLYWSGYNPVRDERRTTVNQLFSEYPPKPEDVAKGNTWTFADDKNIPEDILVKTKFISAETMYDFYKEFTSR